MEDLDGLAALPFFMSLRAAIRAKVIAAQMRQAEAAKRGRLAETAKVYFGLAARLLAPPAPMLVAIGGLSGTGKSALARALAPFVAPEPGAVVVRSDIERKILFGVAETERLSAEAYRDDVNAKVYARISDKAARILAAGHSAVADAVFARAGERAAIADIAAKAHARFHGIFLVADLDDAACADRGPRGRCVRRRRGRRARAGTIFPRRRRLGTDRCVGQPRGHADEGARRGRLRAAGNVQSANAEHRPATSGDPCMSTYRFDRLFEPRSIALLGASPREKSVGRTILKNLRDGGFEGSLQLVNPDHAEIEGIAAVKSVDALPVVPDVAVIAAPPPTVPETVATLGAKGCAAAVIITSGLGHGPGSLAEATRQAAHVARHAARWAQLSGYPRTAHQAQRQLHGADAAGRRSGVDLAIGRHCGRPDRMGGPAPGRLLRHGLRGRHGRRRFRRPARFISRSIDDTRAILLYIEADSRCAQVHVGGAGRRAHQADRRGQGRTARAGSHGRAHAHRRAGRLRRGLRRRVPPGRACCG